MALIGCEAGINAYLEPFALNKASAANLKVHLYTNNYTPVAASDVGNFTECTDSGYSAQTLTGSSFTMGTDGSGNSQASYPAITWTFNGNVTIYGYYVTDGGSNHVIWAELFSSSLAFSANQQLQLTLKLSMS